MEMILGILTAAVVLGVLGILVGIFLCFAAKKFHIQTDEREDFVRSFLPGNNCGACGYAGCDALAEAIASKKADVNACPICSKEAIDKIADIMGTESKDNDRRSATVKCAGTYDITAKNYIYYGNMDCRQAAVAPGNAEKKCMYGCMGLGSCVEACKFDAIHVIDGIAAIDKKKCVACGKCVDACPNKLIELVPYDAEYIVKCNSNEKGKAVKEVCETGCIACMRCVKACKYDAIHVENNLARIDYSKCVRCGKCAEVCPVNIIK